MRTPPAAASSSSARAALARPSPPPLLLLLLACAAFAAAARAQAPAARAGGDAPAAQGPAAAPRLLATINDYEGPSALGARRVLAAFSPDGRLLALSGPRRTVRLYEAATGRPLHTLAGEKEGGGFNGFAFSPDSRVCATRNLPDRSVSLWDLSTGKLLRRLPGRERDIETKLKASATPSEEFVVVPFSPDGRAVLSEREDDIVAAWDVATGEELYRLEHKTETNAAKDVLRSLFLLGVPPTPLMMAAAFSPDGSRVVTANGDGSPKLWDASTGRLVAALTTRGENVYAAAFLPAGGGLLTLNFRGLADLWDAATGAHREKLIKVGKGIFVFEFGHDGGRAAYSADGRFVAAQVDGDDADEVKIWDAADGRLLTSLKQNKADLLAFSPDGRTLAAAGGDKRSTARLYDPETGKLKATLARVEGGARTLAFSPDGRWLVTTSGKGVRLWAAETGALAAAFDRARFPAHFSPDGRLLVTGGTDKTASLYELGR